MPESTKRGYLNLGFSARSANSSSLQSEEEQLRILILGDFSGHAGSFRESDENSGSIPVDYDNFDTVLARVGPIAQLDVGGEVPLTIKFRCLEDFHPDQLLSHIESLSRLIELRNQLLNPSTARTAGQQVQELLQLSAAPSESPKAISVQSSDDLFSQLLGKTISDRSPAASPVSPVDHLIRELLGNPSDAVANTDQNALRTALENELSKRLRNTLHHPTFQTLEATWRGLDFLVRNAGESTVLRLSDISKSKLTALLTNGHSAETPITELLNAFRPALILGIYGFGPEEHHTLSAIARICEAHQTAFVAGANAELAGWTTFDSQDGRISSSFVPEDQDFASLRRKPEADHLGLMLPRFLLRQAYGIRSDPIETFPFEEIDAKPNHEFLLWGNSAFLCGYLMSANFGESGWNFDIRQGGEISGLPVQQIVTDGEADIKPCAEAWLSETAEEAIRSRGIIPVLSIRGRDAVRITSLNSVSAPPRNLAVRGP